MSLVNKEKILHVMCKSKSEANEHIYCTPPKHLDNEITDGSISNIFFSFSFKETHQTVVSTFEHVLFISIQMEKLFVWNRLSH